MRTYEDADGECLVRRSNDAKVTIDGDSDLVRRKRAETFPPSCGPSQLCPLKWIPRRPSGTSLHQHRDRERGSTRAISLEAGRASVASRVGNWAWFDRGDRTCKKTCMAEYPAKQHAD